MSVTMALNTEVKNSKSPGKKTELETLTLVMAQMVFSWQTTVSFCNDGVCMK